MTSLPDKIYAKTRAALEDLIASPQTNPTLRHSAVQRLAALRQAVPSSAAVPTTTLNILQARESFKALHRERGKLLLKARSNRDNARLDILLDRLPKQEPLLAAEDSEWRTFVNSIAGIHRDLDGLK
jgi:hypothetical protein